MIDADGGVVPEHAADSDLGFSFIPCETNPVGKVGGLTDLHQKSLVCKESKLCEGPDPT